MNLEDAVRAVVQALGDSLEDRMRKVVREEMNQPAGAAEFISLPEAATVVSCSLSTVKEWVKTGALIAYRQGRICRVKVADVRAMMERSTKVGDVDEDAEIEVRARRLLARAG
ncbi:MAG: helix-turn-helix domain-containing protein [Myxococcaceae bacterium]